MFRRKAAEFMAKPITQRLGRFAKQWGKDLLPGAPGQGLLSPRALAETAIWYGPDILLWPSISASMLPAGTSAADRAKVFMQDAGINVGASLIGQSGGIGIARALGKGKGTGTFTTLKTIGDMAAAPLNMGVRRPTETKIYNQLAAEQEQALIERIRAEEQMKAQQLLQSLLTGGASYRKEDILRAQLGLPWGGMS